MNRGRSAPVEKFVRHMAAKISATPPGTSHDGDAAGGIPRSRILCVTVAVLALVFAAVWGSDIYDFLRQSQFEFSARAFQDLILSWGGWGVLGSIVLMIVHSFLPFPAEFLAIANGVVWGPFWGTVVTWVGAMGGAIITFWLVRKAGDRFIRAMVPEKHLSRIDGWVDRQGTRFFLITRLIPIISFDLLNIAAGLTRMTWWTFLWTTGLGILPMTSLMVVMGDQIDRIPLPVWILVVCAIVILGLVSRRGYTEVRGL